MRKLLFTALIAVFTMTSVNAQTFGLVAGYDSSTVTIDIDGGGSADGDEGGFYIGAFAEFEVSDVMFLRPEVIYSTVKDFNTIKVPVLLGYEFAEGFSGLFGPSFDLVMDKDGGTGGDDFLKSLNLGLSGGLAYDFSDQFFADARYTFGLSDISDVDGLEIKASSFMIGVGYKFN